MVQIDTKQQAARSKKDKLMKTLKRRQPELNTLGNANRRPVPL